MSDDVDALLHNNSNTITSSKTLKLLGKLSEDWVQSCWLAPLCVEAPRDLSGFKFARLNGRTLLMSSAISEKRHHCVAERVCG